MQRCAAAATCQRRQAGQAAELIDDEFLALLQAIPPTSYAQHYKPCMQSALAAADAGDTVGVLAQLAQVCGEAPAAGHHVFC